MKSTLSSIVIIVGWILVIGLWVNGCMHSTKKHKDDYWILRESPVAIYRGLEYFWHNDFADVNWEERIKSDANTIFILLNLSSETTNIENTKEQIETFSEKINKYPTDKINLLKSASKLYIKYNSTVSNESFSYLNSILEGEDIDPKNWGPESHVLANSLINKYEISPTSLGINSMDSMAISLRLKVGFGEISELKSMKNNIPLNTKIIMEGMNEAYKKIFKEPNE